jgi:hypothetical protein
LRLDWRWCVGGDRRRVGRGKADAGIVARNGHMLVWLFGFVVWMCGAIIL